MMVTMENLETQPETGFLAQPAAATASGEPTVSRFHRLRNTLVLWLDRGIFACLCFIAAVTVSNPFAARWALWAAPVLWLLRLPFTPSKKSEREPLVLPLLVFLSLVAVATFLSYAPMLSWDRMGWFTFMVVALLVAQTVRTLPQAKILIVLLLASGMVSALRTGWQYVNGIGAELVTVAPNTPLYKDGLRSGDLIQMVNHH